MFNKAGKAGMLILLSIFILALIALACLNFPQSDDYMLFLLNSKYGFWGLQEWIFKHNTGRYFSSLVGATFQQGNFLYKHYAIHTVLLIFGNIGGFFILLRSISYRLLYYRPGKATLLIYSVLLFLVSLCISPDIRSDFFWFSSSVTYRLPVIFVLFLIAAFIHLILDGYSIHLAAVLALIIIILGSNELIAITIAFTILFFLFKRKKTLQLSAKKSWIIAATILTSLAILFWAPGISRRRIDYPDPEILTTISSLFFWTSLAFWNMFKSPLFLFFCVDLFFIGVSFKSGNHFATSISNKILAGFLGIQILSLGIILHFVHGSLAVRALNVFSCCFFLYVLVCIWKVASKNNFAWDAQFLKVFNNYKFVVYGILLISSQFFADITQSLFAGYYLNQAYKERVAILQTAANNGSMEATIPSYTNRLQTFQVPGNKKYLKQIMESPPRLIYFSNPMDETINYQHLCNYFQLNKIWVDGKEYLKIDPAWY